ncbi:MAG: hypothetical protein MJ180_02370 [Candidatus Gastranaerophilales bacterium]|nr:hypothetical protein [Candidatus Gastranaerophilales bacterium]
MGLAASQARYLALTARKSDLEYQSQTINSRRIQLAYKTAEIAREYSEGMNNSRIKMRIATVGTDGKTNPVWEELTFSNLRDNEYMIIGSQGTALDPSPYVRNGKTETLNYTKKSTVPSDVKASLTPSEYTALPGNSIRTLYKPVYKDNTNTEVDHWELRTDISIDEFNAIGDDITGSDKATTKALYQSAYQEHQGQVTNLTVNPDYAKNHGNDIQSLLVSGKAQIVTRAFFNYLESHGYDFSTGLSGSGHTFEELQQAWENSEDDCNTGKQKSIIDWRCDESETFASRTYTEDDEKVLAKYEADTAKVQAQDKQLEIEEKNIETQHKAIETELENIKKVIQKNIEDTFKIFS